MSELRNLIQARLNEITDVESGVPIPDDVVEAGKVYFGYELRNNLRDNGDHNKNLTREVNIIGRLVVKDDFETDTLLIIDNAASELDIALKDLNFKCRYEDITLDKHIRKILVSGSVIYNEINNKLIF